MNDLASSFEINVPDIDTNALKKEVADRIEQRRDYALKNDIDFEKLAQPTYLEEENENWSFNLLEHVMATSLLFKPYTVSPEQNIFGRVLDWIRKQAHNLVIYYVNILGKKQTLFNDSAIQLIALQKTQTETLQKKVIELEERIQQLETHLAEKENYKDE